MKIYLSGKITGDPNYRKKFEKAASFFSDAGYVVMNPAVLPEGMTPQEYMSINIPMLFAADAVAFLPDWTKSRGAQIEHELSQYAGKKVYQISGELKNLVMEEEP